MTYIKVNDILYPATIDGQIQDYAWDGRETKKVTMEATYEEILALLPDGTAWSIVSKDTVTATGEDGTPLLDENGAPQVTERVSEWDNSDYSLSGPVTDNRDGTVSITMGKPTDLEDAYAMMLGGEVG